MDELFGTRFVDWLWEEEPPSSARYADDLGYFCDQADDGMILSFSPGRIQNLLMRAQRIDWRMLRKHVHSNPPNEYSPDFSAFQGYVGDWLALLSHINSMPERGLIIMVG